MNIRAFSILAVCVGYTAAIQADTYRCINSKGVTIVTNNPEQFSNVQCVIHISEDMSDSPTPAEGQVKQLEHHWDLVDDLTALAKRPPPPPPAAPIRVLPGANAATPASVEPIRLEPAEPLKALTKAEPQTTELMTPPAAAGLESGEHPSLNQTKQPSAGAEGQSDIEKKLDAIDRRYKHRLSGFYAERCASYTMLRSEIRTSRGSPDSASDDPGYKRELDYYQSMIKRYCK